jgi:hypothetical protein
MNNLIKYIPKNIFLIALLFLVSCKKEVIKDPVVSSTPVFTADVQLGEEEFVLEAGNEDVFMQTYTILHNGVNRFSGKLGKEDVYVEMGVYQGDLDMNEPFSLKNFQGALHFIETPTEPLAVLSKNDFPNTMSIDEIVWFVDGEEESVNTLQINEPGKYQVCAEVHFYGGEVETLCNELLIGYYTNANCRIRHFINANNALKVWIDEESVSIGSIDWYVDGVKTSESVILEMQIDQNSHKIMAEINFTNGTVRRKAILVEGSQEGHFIDDFSHVEQAASNQMRWDYGVLVQVKKNGKLYTTLDADNSDSNVQVNDITYYGLNDQGKHVYKCLASVNCTVKDVLSGEILPLTFTTQFGLEMN